MMGNKFLQTFLVAVLSLFVLGVNADDVGIDKTSEPGECNGKFPNPIEDYCWSCVFPMKIAGLKIPLTGAAGKQEDNDTNVGSVCTCGRDLNATIGLTTSYWEPIVMVDVVRKPFCLSGLGGVDMATMDAPPAGFPKIDGGAVSKGAFYQVHWYINPVMSWIGMAIDNSCVDKAGFDIAYLTELDPLWNDDELSAIIHPDIYLFANPFAQLACTADCAASTAGFPLDKLYWCAGCQGPMLPATGNIKDHTGLVDSSSLLLQRFAHKAHRELLVWGASGEEGACYKYPKYLMSKSDYKYTMTFPKPQKKIMGTCCQPFGRTTVLWGAGKERAFVGEDAVYQVFRKRDCCVGQSVVNAVQ